MADKPTNKKGTGYTGNKGVNDIYKNIINEMPPIKRYIEIFAGSGMVIRHVKAPEYIAVEIDPKTVETYSKFWPENTTVLTMGDLEFLRYYKPLPGDLIYLDPPYRELSTRSAKKLYRHSLNDDEHYELLELINKIDAPVIISHYTDLVYEFALEDWRRKEFTVATRRGPAQEVIWMNFPEALQLNQYDYIGENKTDRQRIKRKAERLIRKLNELPSVERSFLVSEIQNIYLGSNGH